MTFSGPVINQSACGIYLSHIIMSFPNGKSLSNYREWSINTAILIGNITPADLCYDK